MQMLLCYEFLIGVFLRAGSSLMSVYLKKCLKQEGIVNYCGKRRGTIYSYLRNNNKCSLLVEIV